MIVDKLLYEIGIDTKGVQEGLNSLQSAATKIDNEFNGMASRWGGVIQGVISNVIAPVAGAFAIGKIVNSYMSDVSEVATLTGAYNQKLDEWRIKRAQLARVTKEDIELYKQYKEAMTGFNIAIADVSAKLMRSFAPVMKLAVNGLQDFTKWINRNQDNITRFLLVLSGVLTGVFLPAILKTSAALLMSPLTWLIGALGVLVLVFDDLTTYIRGGKSAFGDFWAIFGTGPEIMQKLNKAFEGFKQIISIIWKPLAIVIGLFAGFKIAAVMAGMFTKSLLAIKGAMTAIAAHPIMAMLVALVSLILWISDAFERAGGDWQKTFELMGQDVIDFLNIFGGLGDLILSVFEPVKDLLSSLGGIITGVLSTLANIGQLLWSYLTGGSEEAKAKIVDAIEGSIKHAFESLVKFANNLIPAFLNLISAIGSGLSSLGDLVLQGLTAAFSFAFDVIIKGLQFVLDAILGVFRGLSYAIGRLIEGVSNLLGSIATSIAGAFSALFSGLLSIISGITSDIANLFSGISSAVIELSNLLGSIATSIAGAFSALFSGLLSIISGITSDIANLFSGISSAVIEFASNAYSYFTSAFDSLSNAITAITNTIANSFTAAYESIKAIVLSLVASITDGLKSLQAFASGLWQGIQDAIKETAEAIGSFFGNIWSSINSVIELCTQSAKAIFKLFSNPFETLKGMANSIGKLVSGAFDSIKQTAGNVVDWISSAWNKLPESIKTIVPIDWLLEKFNQVKGQISGLIDSFLGLGSKIAQVFNNVTTAITSAFDAGLQSAMEFFNSVLSFFTDIPNKIAAAFDISGLIDGAKDKLKGLAGGAMDGVKSFFGFGDTKEEQEQTTKAANQTIQSTLQTINTGLTTNNQTIAAAPVTANTSSITNSTYNNDNSRRANTNQINNTVNINVPNGADARGIVREAEKSFNNLNASNNYVMASEYGNFNT